MRKFTVILFFTFLNLLVGLPSCQKDKEDVIVPVYIENTKLKNRLQGWWERKIEVESTLERSLLINQIYFKENSASWIDSTVNFADESKLNGTGQTVKGKCPAKYSFKDGINHYNPLNSKFYWFEGISENNIVWLIFNEGEQTTITNYELTNGIVSIVSEYKSNSFLNYIGSCYVTFDDSADNVTFCEPIGFGNYTCLVYTKKK